MEIIRSTTILAVKKNGRVFMGGDGQVTLGNTVMKGNAVKVRKVYNDTVLTGFAGASADAFNLLERFEGKLTGLRGNLKRAVVELAKDWRSDKYLRKLDALLLAANCENLFLLSGTGDIIEPEEDILAIGSGGSYAQAAAKALFYHTDMDGEQIVREALKIAADICIYTNGSITVETLSDSQGLTDSQKPAGL